jgi:hypothetical protein
MPTQLPPQTDPYLLLAKAVIMQAFEDLSNKDPLCARRARWWLESDGLDWWEMIGYDRSILQRWLART